jgi:hypothetical protein
MFWNIGITQSRWIIEILYRIWCKNYIIGIKFKENMFIISNAAFFLILATTMYFKFQRAAVTRWINMCKVNLQNLSSLLLNSCTLEAQFLQMEFKQGHFFKSFGNWSKGLSKQFNTSCYAYFWYNVGVHIFYIMNVSKVMPIRSIFYVYKITSLTI